MSHSDTPVNDNKEGALTGASSVTVSPETGRPASRNDTPRKPVRARGSNTIIIKGVDPALHRKFKHACVSADISMKEAFTRFVERIDLYITPSEAPPPDADVNGVPHMMFRLAGYDVRSGVLPGYASLGELVRLAEGRFGVQPGSLRMESVVFAARREGM